MLLLKFVSSRGREIGTLNWYAIHPTSMAQYNEFISGDNKGYASYLLEQDHGTNPYTAAPTYVAAFANANCGDVSGNLRLGDIGLFLRDAIRTHFDARNLAGHIREGDDLGLEQGRKPGADALHVLRNAVRGIRGRLHDPLAHGIGQVETGVVVALLEQVHDPQVLPGPAKAAEIAQVRAAPAVEPGGHQVVQRPRAGASERRLAEIVGQRDRLDQVFAQAQSTPDRAGELRHLQRVGQTIATVVLVLGQQSDERFLSQPAERTAVDHPVPVTLESGSVRHGAAFRRQRVASGRARGAHRPGSEPGVLLLLEPGLKGSGHGALPGVGPRAVRNEHGTAHRTPLRSAAATGRRTRSVPCLPWPAAGIVSGR